MGIHRSMGEASIATPVRERRASDSRWRSVVAFAVGAVVATGLLVAVPAPAEAAVPSAKAPLLERTDDVITSDPLPTVQIDSGYVWAQTTIGTTVYAAGSFSNARAALAEPGTNLTPRSNILAYDITTGGLLPFAPTVNGVIKSIAASPDGKRIYIGGTFTTVNGINRYNFAALDAKTGAVVPGMSAAVGGSGVYAITATADTVYIGGSFTQVNGVARKNLAALDASNAALRAWNPTTDLQADALVMEPGGAHVIVGGRFYRVNGVVQRGLAALSPTTGALDTGWAAPQTVRNGGPAGTSYAGKSGIFALTTDAKAVYGTGWTFIGGVKAGNLEGTFAAEAGSGAIRWVADCHGDSYGIYATGKTIYTTNHMHACETMNLWPDQSPGEYRYLAAFTATAEGTLSRSMTADDFNYADWSGTPSPSAYAVTPDFTVGTASGLGQAGLSITGAGDYIAVAGEFTSVNNKRYQGIVRFSTNPAGGAKQGPRLSGSAWATPTASSTVPGRVRVSVTTNWDRDNCDLTYQLLREGSDAPVDQLTATSLWWSRQTVVLSDGSLTPGATATYRVRAVDADGNVADSVSIRATAAAGAVSPYANAVLDDRPQLYYPLGSIRTDWAGGRAPLFESGVTTATPGAVAGDTGATASAFAGTASGNVASPTAAKGDDDFTAEAWFKTNTTKGGKIFGYESTQTGATGANDRNVYMQNNGRLTFGLYPGATKTVSTTAAYNDNTWHHVVATLGATGMLLYVDGELVAQDASVRSAQKDYSGYWRVGYGRLENWPSKPTSSAFAGAVDEFAVYPSALSSDQISLHYAVGKGLPSPAANTAPVAAFATQVSGLSVSVDGAGSSDADGTVASYAWDWGDGSAAGSGATASHTYATAGTYTVTLTVTDDRGATGTKTAQVVATAPPAGEPAIARDAFERSGSSGWGTADVGGAWTVSGGAASAASVSDGAGRLALAAGSTRNLMANAVSAKNVTLSMDVSVDQTPSTGSTYAGVIARSAGADGYVVRTWFHANGSVWLVIQKGSTVLSSYQVPGLTRGAGDVFTVKVDVSGDASTVISAKVWKTGTAEPSGWQSTFTDTSGIAAAGAVGVHASRASSATSTATVAVDNFRVTNNHGRRVCAGSMRPGTRFRSACTDDCGDLRRALVRGPEISSRHLWVSPSRIPPVRRGVSRMSVASGEATTGENWGIVVNRSWSTRRSIVTTLSCSVAGVAVAALLLSACAPVGSSGAGGSSPSPSASQILPPGGAGSDAGDGPQTPAPLPTQEAVVGETVAFETGVSVVVSSVKAVTVEAQTPGEVSGSAVVVEVTASNESDEVQDLESAVVMLSADDGEVGVGTTAGEPEPLAGSVKPGGSVTGRYVFMLGSAKDRAVTVSVNYAAGEPVAIFSGKVS